MENVKTLDYSEISDLCGERKMYFKDLCNYIGITQQGLRTSLNSGKLDSDKVFSLCRCLKITPNQFFRWADIDFAQTNNTQNELMNNQIFVLQNIDILQHQLTVKDEQIAKLLALLSK